jgi:pyruvate,water dikinase
MLIENGKVSCLVGKEKERLEKFFSEDVGSHTILTGKPAYLGKKIGRVKLVYSTKDFPKVRSGDILVTSMTNPHMVPIMKKAAAFVTDEGGITSHAAIIAREMKKPCIIGTKLATQVLKDGDLIKVDANNGVVKILNK